jgi:dsDNA-specific endonuclease/ATPase MutS2
MKNYNLFEQVVDDYKNDYGNFSDDIDKMINRVYEDTEDIKARFNEKVSELNEFNLLRNEYETCFENLSKIIQHIETKTRQTNVRLNLDLLKVNSTTIFLPKKSRIFRI